MTDPTPKEQQQLDPNQVQYMAVPLTLMGAVVKVLSTLPYEQVAQIIPALTACQQITASPKQDGLPNE